MSTEAPVASNTSHKRPIIPVYPYQARVIDDRSRLIGWVKSRQIGGSFTCTLKVALDAIENREDWNMMSRSQRQAEKLLLKVAKHVRAINQYVVGTLNRPPIVKDDMIGASRITLLNGTTIEALPCDPDTTTGDTANWFLDEFALYPKSDAIFGVIKPSILHGKKMLIVSSPRGRQHKFHDLWKMHEQARDASGWSWHKTTIEDAVRDDLPLVDQFGNPIDFAKWADQEKRDIGEELFLQEYMCVFSDKLIAFLPYALILRCQDPRLKMAIPPDMLSGLGRDLWVGVDVGRRHDLTVIWVVSRTGECHRTESVYVLDQTPFDEQKELLGKIMANRNVVSCAMDASPIGMNLVENLQDLFPGRIDPVNFTNTSKGEMSQRLKILMQSENFYMPPDADIVADFESIERDFTDSGNVRISAPRSASGHGDRFWAACLACHAAASHRPFELVLAA